MSASPSQRAEAPSAPAPARSLFRGVVDGQAFFPFPRPPREDLRRTAELVRTFAEHRDVIYPDPREAERDGWIGDGVVTRLGELGLMGLQVPRRYGGAGLSMTGACSVFHAMAAWDPGLAIVLGIHQSIGTQGLVAFGNEAQKERFLPDLAAGHRLAGFALTERGAGSDASNIRSRAVRLADGSWRLDGEKRYVGNGSVGSLFTVIARAEATGVDRHIALLVERGMEGFEVAERHPLLGVEVNDVRQLRFHGVRVPAENVLGEPGDGFEIAMKILAHGRLGLGSIAIGAAAGVTDLVTEHVKSRQQFGRPLAEFEFVRDKIAWATRWIFGAESMLAMTSALADRGADVTLEASMGKLVCSELAVRIADTALQLRGGEGYVRRERYEKVYRDVRVFPVFEGANDVLRSYIAIAAMRHVGRSMRSDLAAGRDGSASSAAGDSWDVHPRLTERVDAVAALAQQLGATARAQLQEHGMALVGRQLQHGRLTEAATLVYAQLAALARSSQLMQAGPAEHGERALAIAEAFCDDAGDEVRSRLSALADNDDGPRVALADLAYASGASGHAFPGVAPDG